MWSNTFSSNGIFFDPITNRYWLFEGEELYKEKQWIIPTFIKVATRKTCLSFPANFIKYKEFQTKFVLINSLQKIKKTSFCMLTLLTIKNLLEIKVF